LIFSWLSWLAVSLVGMHDGGDNDDDDDDDDDDGITQHGDHNPNNRLTEICSLGLLCTCLILDFHAMMN